MVSEYDSAHPVWSTHILVIIVPSAAGTETDFEPSKLHILLVPLGDGREVEGSRECRRSDGKKDSERATHEWLMLERKVSEK